MNRYVLLCSAAVLTFTGAVASQAGTGLTLNENSPTPTYSEEDVRVIHIRGVSIDDGSFKTAENTIMDKTSAPTPDNASAGILVKSESEASAEATTENAETNKEENPETAAESKTEVQTNTTIEPAAGEPVNVDTETRIQDLENADDTGAKASATTTVDVN